MKLLYFLPLLLVIPTLVYADTGINYDRELVSVNPNGTLTIKWISSPERILVNNQYVDYRFTDTAIYLSVETGHGSVKLNKTTCSFDFYKKGIIQGQPLFTDSIVAKIANDGTENWNELTQISNATCEAYGDQNELVAKKYVFGVGLLEYKYINTGYTWKTQLEATNLSLNTNKKFGFTQTIDINRDVISFGGQQRNLDNFSGQTFGRAWLENNQAKVLNFLNDVMFDFDIGFNHLESVAVYDTGENRSKLAFNYIRNAQVILPTQKIIVDPTFGYNSGTVRTITDTGCNLSADGTSATGYVGANSGPTTCYNSAYYFDITTIPDTSYIVTVNFRSDTTETYSASTSCPVTSIEGNVSTMTDQQLEDDIRNGTTYTTVTTQCRTVANNYVISTASMSTDLQSELAVDNEWAIGMYGTNYADAQLARIVNPELEVTYTTNTPPVPSSLSCSGAPFAYSCSWSISDASYVTGYYIAHSPNNSTWSPLNVTSLSNVTSTTYYGNAFDTFGVAESNYIRVNSTYNALFNSTTSNVVFATTDNVPDAPSITATTVSTSQINIDRTAGASDGGDTVDDYNLQASINGAAFIDLVTNSTIANFYNHTGLTAGDVIVYKWRDGNDVGWSSFSANATATVWQGTTGTITVTGLNIGDVFNGTATITITTASPSPVTVQTIKILQNGTVVDTINVNQNIAQGATQTFGSYYYLITDGNPHSYQLMATITNVTGTVDFTSTAVDITMEYDPEYFAAIDTTQGYVNYTISRSTDQDEINLKTNRDYSGGTFNIECLYRSMTDAALNSGGTWHNYTSVGYMNDTLTDAAGTHYYIDCYNDGLLFQVVSYTNSSMLLAGIEVFDDTYGAFIGVPVGVFFIVIVAGMANQRTAPMWIVVILAIAGIMSTIGFFTLDTNVWALALIAALLGIIVGRKLF